MIYASGVVGLKRVRETVDDAASKLAGAAENTRAAMGALAVLGLAALAVAVIALVIAVKGRKAATA